MKYYAFIVNNKISGKGQCPCQSEGLTCVVITQEIYENIDKYMWNGSEVIFNPDWEQEEAQRERQRLDALTLTPADVERALYKEKQMDFDDLKVLISQAIPQIDTKALSIEFRAKDFFRGAMYGNMRLFDVVGALLGYTPADMDYLFEYKELPTGE